MVDSMLYHNILFHTIYHIGILMSTSSLGAPRSIELGAAAGPTAETSGGGQAACGLLGFGHRQLTSTDTNTYMHTYIYVCMYVYRQICNIYIYSDM